MRRIVRVSQAKPFLPRYRTMARTLKCQYTFEMPNFDKVSDNAKDFISSLLILSAEERFSAEQCLNHPWLTDNRVSPHSFTVKSIKFPR